MNDFLETSKQTKTQYEETDLAHVGHFPRFVVILHVFQENLL